MSQLRPPKTIEDKDIARVVQDIYDHLNEDRDTLTQHTIIIQTSGGASYRPITEGGLATGTQMIPSSGISGRIVAGQLTQDVQKFITTVVFSATDTDTVAWTAGTIKLADGSSYAITASNTGNMTSPTYIYFDPKSSTTTLAITTTATDVADKGGIMLCYAQKTADAAQKAMYIPSIGVLGLNSTNIQVGSITSDLLSTNFLTAAQATIAYLTAITADLGDATAGTFTLTNDTAGHIKSGQTAYDTGTGFWLGNDGGTHKFSIGNSAASKFTWNGTTIDIVGGLRTSTGTKRIDVGVGTANELVFYEGGVAKVRIGSSIGGGASAGIELVGMLSVDGQGYFKDVFPYTASGYNLGGPSSEWINIYLSGQIASSIVTGTAPFIVASQTVCTNLNAYMLEGSRASAFAPSSGANYSNWDSAYSQRLQWDGGSTNLTAATGRTSLGLGTIATKAAGSSMTMWVASELAGSATVEVTVVDGIIQ